MPYTRMVPKIRIKDKRLEMECACGEFIQYPTAKTFVVCTCGAEWHVMPALTRKRRKA